jgi:hypothetical protein
MSRLPRLRLWRLWLWRLLRFLGSLPLVLGRRGVIAAMNPSCHGRARPSRPGQFLSFASVVTGLAGSAVDACATRTVSQFMFSHDFAARFSRIDPSDLLRPLTASRLPQELPW